MTTPLTHAELAALAIFPLPNAALFPGTPLPLHVFEPRYRAMVRDALAGTKAIAIARLRPGFEDDYEGRPPVFDVCGAGRIVEHVEHEDGRYHLVLRGVGRIRITRELPAERAYRVVLAEPLEDLAADPRLGAALETKLQELWQTLAPTLPEALRELRDVTSGAEGAGAFSDRLGAVLGTDADLSQRLMSELDPCERLQLIAERLQAVAEAIAPPSARSRSKLN